MKKHILPILILILWLPVLAKANTPSVDSLRSLLPTLEGRDRHFTLSRIAMTTGMLSDWDAVVENAEAQHDTLSVCMAMTNRFICMANRAPADSLLMEIRRSLPFMREARQWTYYFTTYSTYIESLFRQRRYEDAERAATDMFRVAQEEQQPKGMAMALQVQGSMYYKLNLYHDAMSTLEEAFRLCPDYRDKENGTLVISSLICEWLCMTAMKVNDTAKLTTYAGHYADIVAWRQQVGVGDQSGHFTVTAAAFRAQSLLSQDNVREAESLLDKAATDIRPSLPARAYEHYYEARSRQYTLQGRYREALNAADILLTAHREYFPFYLDDMLRKADIVSRMGRADESREIYLRYIQVKDSIERIEIAAQMDKLRTLYEVDRLEAEKRTSIHRLIIALCGFGLVAGVLLGYIFHSRNLRRKNHALYLRIREQEKMEERVLEAIETLPIDSLSKEAQLFCRLSERMYEEKLFTNPALNRKELAALMGTNENYLANAIRSNTDNKTFKEYITDLRLKYAATLLVENREMSIETVGETVGFNSRITFFRAFRERFGMSPSDFRKASAGS